MKYILILFVVLLCQSAFAQNKISGNVTGQDNQPLAGARIFAPELNKGTVADSQGYFELNHLPNGIVRVQFSFLGFANSIETFELTGKPVVFNTQLKQTSIEAEEIVVSGGYNSTQHDNAVKIDVLSMNSASVRTTPNFAEVLTQTPGVDMISKGSGVSKPVIRGLSMNDILILNNGVRFENYQYSSHHPLGIDEFGIENVEIIKGPASLLYGSDAIGGVINFIKEKPAPVGSVVGDYNLQLFSNTLGFSNNLGVKGAAKKFYGGIRIGQKSNSDFLQGGGIYTPNSRFNEYSVKSDVGFTDRIGTFKLFYDFNKQKLGLVEDEAIELISERGRKNELFYQELNTHLLSSQNKLYLGKFKLDLNSSFQRTELAHLGEPGVYEIQMRLATLTYDAKLHLPSNNNSEYILGFQGFNQRNVNLNDRETLLLPDATTNNYSAYGLIQYTFWEKLKVQSGIRYDARSISTNTIGISSDEMTYRPALDQTYGSFSGSLGGTLHLSDQLLLRTNFAAAYRTPNLAELTSNGQHELRYEIGDSGLVPENAFETDLSVHYHNDILTFDISGFFNRINNYIFISPTGETTNSGIEIYRYKQANSTLAGSETGLHLHPKSLDWLHVETTFATVFGQQQGGDYLPFVPAHKLRMEVRAEREKLLFAKKVWASVLTTTAFTQNRAAPDETPTSGYTLVDFVLGGNLSMKHQLLSISVGANNLFDIKYIDHLSTLKEVNLFNPGRNVFLSLKIPFGEK